MASGIYKRTKKNLLYLQNSYHRKIHTMAYNYLVKIGKIEKYIKWFIKKDNPKIYTEKNYLKQKENKK